MNRKLIYVFLALIAAGGVYGMMPADCPEAARRTAFIFILAAIFWAFEIIPLFATSLLVVLLESVLLAVHGGAISYSAFLAPLSNPVIILFLGGFVLARAFQKYEIDRLIVIRLLHAFGSRPYFVLLGFMVTTAFLGMWISNTAATALLLPMIYPFWVSLEPGDAFRKALVLAIPFAARIGGITTPVASPTNAIAIGVLAEHGISIHFLTWTLITLPLAVGLLLVTSFVLYFLFPPATKNLMNVIQASPRADRNKLFVSLIGVVTILFWLTSAWHKIPESIVALFSMSLLAGFKLIDTDDLKKIDWDILILMWGGIALGEGMEKSGLAVWITQQAVLPVPGWELNLMVCLVTVFLSTFMSNTATVNLLIPIALSLPSANPAMLAAIVALAASFDLALPISTPPMAMAYGTKQVSVSDMLRAGSLFAVVANAFLLLGVETMMKKVFLR